MTPLDAEPTTAGRLAAHQRDTFAKLAETDKRLAQGAKVLRTIKGAIVALLAVSGFAAWVFTRTESHLAEHIADSAQVHRDIRADMHELQVDVRAQYRSMRTGLPEPRLERLPDGGLP